MAALKSPLKILLSPKIELLLPVMKLKFPDSWLLTPLNMAFASPIKMFLLPFMKF